MNLFWTLVYVSSNMMYFSLWQLWTVAIWLIQRMARLSTLLEQHLNRQPPTVVTQATTWWETVLAHVMLQESGLRVHLLVEVGYYTLCTCGPFMSILRILLRPFFGPKWCFTVARWQTSTCVNIDLLFLPTIAPYSTVVLVSECYYDL